MELLVDRDSGLNSKAVTESSPCHPVQAIATDAPGKTVMIGPEEPLNVHVGPETFGFADRGGGPDRRKPLDNGSDQASCSVVVATPDGAGRLVGAEPGGALTAMSATAALSTQTVAMRRVHAVRAPHALPTVISLFATSTLSWGSRRNLASITPACCLFLRNTCCRIRTCRPPTVITGPVRRIRRWADAGQVALE